MNKELVRLVLSEPFPCESCEHRHKCGLDLKSCKSFQIYVNTGYFNLDEPRKPTRAKYMKIYWGGKD
jgi:hypothetical protein